MPKGKKRKGIMDKIMLAIIVPILLVVGLITIAYFQKSIDLDTITSATAETTINSTFTSAYNAFNMGTVLPIVVFSAAIITVLFGAFYFGKRGS